MSTISQRHEAMINKHSHMYERGYDQASPVPILLYREDSCE